MNKLLQLLAAVTAVGFGTVFGAEVTMHPKGDVTNLAAALARVRALRAEGKIPADRVAEVRVAPGVYRQTEPVVLTAADSHLRIVADGADGSAVIDGGVELPPFRAGGDGVWRAPVPAGLVFEQLYVNDRRAQRARHPNKFYLYIAEAMDGDRDPRTGEHLDRVEHRAFIAETKDVAALAQLPADELADVEILFWQSWDQALSKIDYVDGKTGLVITRTGTSRPLFFWNTTRPRYALENFRAALDAPGEWFHDKKAGELLYIPRPGETPARTRAVAPVAQGLLLLRGDVFGKRVEDVTFRGLAFRHTAWTMPATGAPNAQSAQNVREAVVFGDGLRNIVLDRCSIRHAGAHGVWFKRGCRSCAVTHCEIEDLGGGGVYLGDTGGWQEDKLEHVTAFNRVEDSIIRGGGFTFNGAIGVWLGHTCDNTIAHNDIGDFRYTGVSMGWTWGYAETIAQRNKLLWNRIHHIGQGVLSDMGAVYTLGDSRGTVEIGNWIHDVNGYAGAGSPAWGLYTDEGSRGILLASNLVERCRDGAVHQHYGRENVWENNIFATFDKNGVWRTRVEDHTTIIVRRNVFWWTNPEAHLLSGSKNTPIGDVVFENNLYWGVNGLSPEAFSGRSLAEWQAAGHDRTARVADPQFADPAKGDWHLARTSPAREMGFVPWDWTDAGVLKKDAAWRRHAMDDSSIPALEDAPKAPTGARTSAKESFERFTPGRHGSYGALKPAAPGGIAVVAGGRDGGQSLKLEDGPGHPWIWHPHLTSRVACKEGSVRIRFAFKTDEVVQPWIECRDYTHAKGEYAAGPSIHFTKGVVTVGGRELGRVAPHTWGTIEMSIHVTGPLAATWDCVVTPAEGAPVVTKGLPVSPNFKALEWVGFMTLGEAKGEWYLDDFLVEPVK